MSLRCFINTESLLWLSLRYLTISGDFASLQLWWDEWQCCTVRMELTIAARWQHKWSKSCTSVCFSPSVPLETISILYTASGVSCLDSVFLKDRLIMCFVISILPKVFTYPVWQPASHCTSLKCGHSDKLYIALMVSRRNSALCPSPPTFSNFVIYLLWIPLLNSTNRLFKCFAVCKKQKYRLKILKWHLCNFNIQ